MDAAGGQGFIGPKGLSPAIQPPMAFPECPYNFGQSPDDVLFIFNQYKQSWRSKLKACGSDTDLLITSLETMVDELIEHNGLLLTSIIELQREASARALQMDRRLQTSARHTEESLIGLDKFTKELQRVIVNNSFQFDVGASDILIEELTNHLEALKIENAYLRDKNENLKHDMGNLLELVKQEQTRSEQLMSKDNSVHDSNSSFNSKCFTFTDTVNPEDVFGEIERISAYPGDTPPKTPSEASLQKPSEPIANPAPATVTTNIPDVSAASTQSSQSSQIIEEKNQLIQELQAHLARSTNEIAVKDELISNIESKLNNSRQKADALIEELASSRKEAQELDGKISELNERIESLNEDKRKLMTQLDQQSEEAIQAKQEVLELTKKLIDKTQEGEYQALTIEHMKDALVAKSKQLNQGLGAFLARPLSPPPAPAQPNTHNANGTSRRGALDEV